MDDQGLTDADFITPDDGFSSAASEERKPTQAAAENHGDEGENGDVDNADATDDDELDELEGLDDEELDEDGNKKPAEIEMEEVDIGGKKFSLPKEVKPLLMMQQDYTRKTQEVAAERNALKQQAEAIQAHERYLSQQAEIQRENIESHAQLFTIDKTLAEYANVDWQRLESEDPLGAGAHWRAFQQLKDQKTELVTNLQQHELRSREEQGRRTQAEQQARETELAKRLQESLSTVQSKIKGWNNDTANEVGTYMRGMYSPEEMKTIATHPDSMVLIYKAMKHDQLMAKRDAKRAAAPKVEAAPLSNVARGRTAPAPSGLDDRLSAEEWARRRNEQISGRRR